MARYNGRSNGGVDEHVTLDGYVVRMVRDLSVGIAKANAPLGSRQELTWLPRSVCDGGSSLSVGDTDIQVELWKADQEGLDY